MWKLRRAARFENGWLHKESYFSKRQPPEGLTLTEYVEKGLPTLENAQKEITATGTLTAAAWSAVLPLLTLEPKYVPQASEGNASAEPKIDDAFLACLERHVQRFHTWLKLGYNATEVYFAIRAVPEEDIMKRLLPYEKAAQNQLDRALQRLIESKERRPKYQAILGVKTSVD